MALHDPVITVESVSMVMPDRYYTTLRLVIPDNDATASGIDETFTTIQVKGSGVMSTNQQFKDMMNACISEYKKEEVRRTNASWETVLTAIKDGLVI